MPLDLSLPEAPRPRARTSPIQWLTFAGVAALIVLAVLAQRPREAPASQQPAAAEAERLKSLATDLERRTLYVEAAGVWGEYLRVAELSADERAELAYRRGKCLVEGGKHAEAARQLTEVESLTKNRDDKRRARQLLLECLAALGKQDVRDSVARAFAVGSDEKETVQKGTIVAAVGSDNITREEIRDDLLLQVEEALRLQGVPLTPAEVAQQAAKIVDEQLKSPENVKKAAMEAASRRVLYREGLERGYADDARMQERVARLRRELIASRVVEEELEGVLKSLGPTDLKNHYDAHRDRFVDRAGVEFSYGIFPGEAEAEHAIEKLKAEATRGEVKMKRVAGAAVQGQPLPELGPAAELTAHILALGEGEVSAKPVAHASAFYVFRAEAKRPEKQLTFEEAQGRVRADLAQDKRRETIENLQANLSQKFAVQILDPAAQPAAPAPAGPAADSAPQPTGNDATKKS